MSRLLKYASRSSLMDITILRDKEKFNFNLFREIKVNENGLDKELRDQPSSYGFLTMLHKELLRKLGDLKVDEKKAYAHAYLKYKAQTNRETNRLNSDDVAKEKAELDPKYVSKQREVISLQFDVSRIEACVRAFEQRKDMLQTLSANIRKEK